MAAHDSNKMPSTMLPDARLCSARNDNPPSCSAADQFVSHVATMKNNLLERFTAPPKVLVHGRTALIWGDYEFLLDGNSLIAASILSASSRVPTAGRSRASSTRPKPMAALVTDLFFACNKIKGHGTVRSSEAANLLCSALGNIVQCLYQHNSDWRSCCPRIPNCESDGLAARRKRVREKPYPAHVPRCLAADFWNGTLGDRRKRSRVTADAEVQITLLR